MYITEKRFAKDGERVIVTEEFYLEEGEVRDVLSVENGECYVGTERHSWGNVEIWLTPDQYEVIIGEETEQ